MKKNTRKNWILSLILAFMMFFGVGVTVTTHKASADIYDVPSANFVDCSKLDYAYYDSWGLDPIIVYDEEDRPIYRGFKIDFLDDIYFGSSDYNVVLDYNPFNSTDGSLRSLKAAGSYVFSWSFANDTFSYNYQNFMKLYLQVGNSAYKWIQNGRAIELDLSSLSSYSLVASFSAGQNSDGTLTESFPAGTVLSFDYFRVNAGTTAFDWEPYYFYQDNDSSDSSSSESNSSDDVSSDEISSDDIGSDDGAYSDGYSDGYADGESAGYDKGFADGSKFAEYGIFGFCQCYIQLNYADGQWDRISITDDFYIYGGLDLSKFKPLVQSYTNVTSSFIFFNFPDLRFSVSQLNFFGTGSETVFVPWSVTLNNTDSSRSLSWNKVPSSTDNNPIYKTDPFSPGIVGSTVVQSFKTPYFETFAYLDDFTIAMADNQYYAGFTNGRAEGYDDGLAANQQTVYDGGFQEGHRVGYDDGFAKGYSENNSFLGLFTAAIDAPIITFTSMLNFDILGYNMKYVALSLLSIALVVAILRLFVKGGAS